MKTNYVSCENYCITLWSLILGYKLNLGIFLVVENVIYKQEADIINEYVAPMYTFQKNI